MNNVTLSDSSNLIGSSKYYLLRSSTKQKRITPYSYLETIHVHEAEQLSEQGLSFTEATLQTKFVDQSHFSNFLKKYIGPTLKQYCSIF